MGITAGLLRGVTAVGQQQSKTNAPNAVVELVSDAAFAGGSVQRRQGAAAFKKYFAKKLPERVQVFYLPSTSPATRACVLKVG